MSIASLNIARLTGGVAGCGQREGVLLVAVFVLVAADSR